VWIRRLFVTLLAAVAVFLAGCAPSTQDAEEQVVYDTAGADNAHCKRVAQYQGKPAYRCLLTGDALGTDVECRSYDEDLLLEDRWQKVSCADVAGDRPSFFGDVLKGLAALGFLGGLLVLGYRRRSSRAAG
jgi:hypothetical protein